MSIYHRSAKFGFINVVNNVILKTKSQYFSLFHNFNANLLFCFHTCYMIFFFQELGVYIRLRTSNTQCIDNHETLTEFPSKFEIYIIVLVTPIVVLPSFKTVLTNLKVKIFILHTTQLIVLKTATDSISYCPASRLLVSNK